MNDDNVDDRKIDDEMNINFMWINDEKMPPPCVEKKNWVPQFNGYPLI